MVEGADSQQTEALLAAFLRLQPNANLDVPTSMLEDLQIMDQQMSSRLQDRDRAMLACHTILQVC